MPKQAIDFSKTIIYKIVCKDTNINDTYIGHTTDFTRRKYEHKNRSNNENKKNNLPLYKFIRENGNWSNWDMIQIEQYPCNDVNQARARERYHVETLKPSLNCDIPNRSKKEYNEDNKEKLTEKAKQYREQNKEIIAEKKKEYYEDNKEKLTEKAKQYREQNKEIIAEKKKEYYEEHKQVIAEKKKEYYEEHKQEVLERVKQYYNENKEKISEYHKQYQVDNKEDLAVKRKDYREQNKEVINKKATERIRCECCNCDVPRRHISTHNKSLKHIDASNKKPNVILD